MSKIALQGNVAGSGTFTLAAPNSDSSYTLNLPQVSGGTLVSTDSSNRVNLTGALGIVNPAGGFAAFSVNSATAADRTGSTFSNTATGGSAFSIRSHGASYSETLFGNNVSGKTLLVSTAGDIVLGTYDVTNSVIFGTANVERFRLDSAGNLTLNNDGITRYIKSSANGGAIGFRANSATTDRGLLLGLVDNSGVFSERMRISNNNNVLIGTTESGGNIGTGQFGDGTQIWPAGASSPAITACNSWAGGVLYLAKSVGGSGQYIEFFQQGNSRGTITGTGTGVTYNTASDYRLKENIQPMQNALAVVAQLKPVTYTWKETGTDGQGFIAHELQAVVPDAVTGDKDAVYEDGTPKYQGIDTSLLVATLTKAIQEQQEQINELKAQVAALTKA